jgi:hypothetical protein
MEQHGYLAVNSEKTMFMKQKGKPGKDWIMHGLNVDNMAQLQRERSSRNNSFKNIRGISMSHKRTSCPPSWAWNGADKGFDQAAF